MVRDIELPLDNHKLSAVCTLQPPCQSITDGHRYSDNPWTTTDCKSTILCYLPVRAAAKPHVCQDSSVISLPTEWYTTKMQQIFNSLATCATAWPNNQ